MSDFVQYMDFSSSYVACLSTSYVCWCIEECNKLKALSPRQNRQSTTYAVVSFRKVQRKSTFAQSGIDYGFSQLLVLCAGVVQLKSKPEHTGT